MMTPKGALIEQARFQPAEMARIARQYYAFALNAHRQAGGQGFVLVPGTVNSRPSGSQQSLADHAQKISAVLASSMPPHTLDMPGVQAALLEQGWLVYWEPVLVDNPAARTLATRTSFLNFACGRVETLPLAEESGLADFTGPAVPVRRLHRLVDERIPSFARVWDLEHPDQPLRTAFQVVGPAPIPREAMRQGIRPAHWDPLAERALVFARPGGAELILREEGLAAAEIALWRRAGAAELAVAHAWRRARPHLLARRMLDRAGKPRGPGRAAQEAAAAEAMRKNDITYQRNIPQYESLAREVDALGEELVGELMLVSMLRHGTRDASELRATARFLGARVSPRSTLATRLAAAVKAGHPAVAGPGPAWEAALQALSAPEALAAGERTLAAAETALRATVARLEAGPLLLGARP